MAADLTPLDPAFREALEASIEAAGKLGVRMVPYEVIRDPRSQGGLWRRSRPRVVVDLKIAKLRQLGANFLADCIEKAGPQNGPWATNAIPGESWHQWGLACDLYWEKEPGKAEWKDLTGYLKFAMICKANGLTHGITFSRQDAVHVQLPALFRPDMTAAEISAEMAKRFPK